MSSVLITFVRHAESQSNTTSNLIGGHNLQVPITPNGEKQALALGSFFMQKGVVFTAAYSSTAIRTQKTAELCFKSMGCDLTLSLDCKLLEQDTGDWEGQSKDIFEREEVKEALKSDNWNFALGDTNRGESPKTVAKRMLEWVNEKVAEYTNKDGDQHIVVFTHSMSIKFFLAELLDLDRSTAYSEIANPIANTSVTQLFYKKGESNPILLKKNEIQHLSSIEELL